MNECASPLEEVERSKEVVRRTTRTFPFRLELVASLEGTNLFFSHAPRLACATRVQKFPNHSWPKEGRGYSFLPLWLPPPVPRSRDAITHDRHQSGIRLDENGTLNYALTVTDDGPKKKVLLQVTKKRGPHFSGRRCMDRDDNSVWFHKWMHVIQRRHS